jgi:hypothetical protein
MTNEKIAITHHRLASQQIAPVARKGPGEVVASLGAMQAQDYQGALWAIGLRLPEATETDVAQAIADRIIVRTWPMRGTLHFVAAADVHWMLKFLTPRIIAGAARRRQELELDDAIFARCEKVFVRALQGGNQVPRDELLASLQRARISITNQRSYHILWRLAQEGLICFGAHQGKQPTFALLDEWAPKTRNLERAEALAELARRYFTSHGPATVHDFAWWSGLKISEARAAIEMTAAHLTSETIDGKVYWMSPDRPALRPVLPRVHLLPGFDEYMLGYQDRSAALDPQHVQKILPGSNGVFMPTIVINGRVAGTWKRVVKKKSVVITAAPFASLKKAEVHALAAAAERYGRFLNLPVELSWVAG